MALGLVACVDGAALTRDSRGPEDVTAHGDGDARESDARDGDGDGDARESDAPSAATCGASCFACERDGCDPIVGLSVGRLGACVLLASGEPVCWGRAIAGALGEGLHGSEPLLPFRVHDRPRLVELGVAAGHACGRDPDGPVWCWGDAYYGVATPDRRSFAALAPTLRIDGARRLVVGPLGSACALRDDGWWCWGLRLDGVESDESGATFATQPERIDGLPAGPRAALAIGAFAACAHDPDSDAIACFGAHAHGQLGAGAAALGGLTPHPVVRPWGDARVTSLALGHDHGCVVAGDALWCWGDLGPVATEPIRVADALDSRGPLAAGRDFTCAVVGAERGVTCWGAPSPALTGVVELAAADASICARTDDERVACWQRDRAAVDIVYRTAEPAHCSADDDALALGDDAPEACRLCGPDGAVAPCPFACAGGRCVRPQALAAGDTHTCALLEDGAAWCWGDGRGPEPAPDLPRLVAIAAGRARTCGIGIDGAVACWGSSHAEPSPGVVAEARAGALDVGGDTTCAVVAGGAVVCWGTPLGASSEAEPDPIVPTRVEGLEGFVVDRVAVGEGAACVSERVTAPARPRVACWGQNDEGQLGGAAGPAPEARVVDALGLPTTIGALAAGRAHVLLGGGGAELTVYGWGASESGQLGSLLAVRPPGQVLGGWSFNLAAVVAGDAFSCALERTGRLTCFGADGHGQLGPGAAGAGSVTPVVVGGLGPAVAVAAGARHVCAIDRAGLVYCWGDNRAGQLGGGSPGSNFAPEPRWVHAP